MVLSRTSVDAPKTFAGQINSYAHDTEYQERKVIRTAINAPIVYATPLVTLTRTGVAQPGLQQYTSP